MKLLIIFLFQFAISVALSYIVHSIYDDVTTLKYVVAHTGGAISLLIVVLFGSILQKYL